MTGTDSIGASRLPVTKVAVTVTWILFMYQDRVKRILYLVFNNSL